ncbi:MAG TPA: serine protease [Gemmataceae bacterium]|nr:serine protease [Gemmataceae bacterium]
MFLRPCLSLSVRAALLVWSLASHAAVAAPLDEAYLAVVQMPSHGASGTIVYTASDETIVLTVAHAFEGAARNRPMVVLVPRPEGAGIEKRVGIRLVAIDARADLALVRLGTGPLGRSARVAPRGFNGPLTWAYSCGYDGMQLPAVWARTRIRGSQGQTTFTEQTPGHGRSGGALFDAGTGYLVGVVQGYTLERPPVGLYASLTSIHAFLDRNGFGRVLGDAEPRGSLPEAAGPGASGRRDDPAPARPCPQ